MWEYNPSTGKYEWKPKTQNNNVGEFDPKILQRVLAPGPTEEEVAGAIFERGTSGPVEESFVTAKPVEGTLLPTVSEQERVKKISQAAEVVGENLAPFEDPDLVLYRSQSYPEAIGNFLGRQAGIVTGIIGQSAAMVDLEDYKNADNEIGNSITRWANEVNQSLDQEYFPIYQDPRAQSLGEQLTSAAWWLDNGSQLTRSVGSFVGAGLVAGAVTGGLGTIAKGLSGAVKLGKITRAIDKGAKFLEAIGLTGDKLSQAYTAGTKGLDALARSTMLTQAEGITEAIDVYDNIYNTSVQKGMSEEEAKMKAAEGASATVAANRVNILLNMTSAAQFMRPMQSSRQILKEVTKLNTVKSFLGEGFQEAAEEQVNLLASEYGKSVGLGTNFDPAKVVTSDEGIKSSLLGFIGGAGQTSITAATNEAKFNPMSRMKADDGSYISKNEYLRREYAKQQEEIEKIREMGNTQAIRDVTDAFDDLESTAKTQFEYIQAIENNDEAKLKEIDDRLLAGQAIRSFQTGTAEILEETYKSYAALTPEQAEARGLDTRAMVNGKANPDYYVTKANDAIAKIKRLENRFNTTRTYLDGLDLDVEGATNTDKNTFKNFLLSRVLFETAFQNHAENSIRDLNNEITSLSNGFSEEALETLDEAIRVAEENKALVSKTNRPEGTKERVIRQYEKEIADLKAQRAVMKAKEPTNDSKELIRKNEEDVARLAKELEDSIAETNRLTDSKIQLTDFKKYLDGTKNQQAQANAQNIKQQAQATNTAKTQSAQQQQTVVNNAPTSPLVNSPYNLPFADGSAGLNIGEMVYDSNGLPFVFKGYDPNTGLYTIVKPGGGEVKYTEAGMQGFTKNPPAATQTQNKVTKTASETEVDPEYYTKQKENEVKAESEKLDEEVLRNDPNVETNVNPDNSLEYLYVRSKVGNNKLAYLSRGYVQTLSGKAIERSDINNVLNDFLFKPLLNPAKYNAGTPITLLVEDNNDTEMYNPLSDTKEKTTWGAVKATYNLQPGTKEYNDLVPVAIYDNKNNKIGYLHSTDWIKEENIDNTTEAIEEDKNTLSNIRQAVASKPEGVKTKIESKSIGVLFKTSDGKSIPTSTAMPDPKLTIAYGKGNGVFETSRGEQFKGTIVNDSIPGIVYAVMPMGDTNIAIPLDRTKLGADQINIVLKAIRAWVDDDKATILDINNATDGKINVAEFSSLKDLLNYFIYSYNTNGQNFKDVLTNLTVNNSEKRLIHVSGNSIEFGRPGLANTWKSINKNAFKLYPADKQNEVYAELAEYLQEQYFNINAGLLGADVSIPTVNQNGEVETQFKGKYNDFVKTITTTNILTAEVELGVYTPFIQPNVTISTEFIEEKEAEPILTTANIEIKPITPSAAPTADIKTKIADIEKRRQERLKPVSEENPKGYFENTGIYKKDKVTGEEYYDPDVKNGTYSVDFSEDEDVDDFIDADSIEELKSKINAKYDAELAALEEEIDSVDEVQKRLNEDLGVTSKIVTDAYLNGLHYIQTESGKYYVIPDSNAAGYGGMSAKEVTKEQIIKPFRTEDEWKKVGINVLALEKYEPTGLRIEDFQIGEEEEYEDDGMNLGEDELPSSDQMLPETTAVYKDFMVKGLNLNQQSQLVDAVAGDAYRTALQEQGKKEKTKLSTIKDKNKAIIQEKLNVVERNLLRAQAKKDQASINLFTKKKQILGGIIEDWNKVSALIDGKIAKLNGDTAAMDLESVVIDDQEFVRNTFDDDYALTVDSKNTISAQFRKFLAFTTELDSDYKVVPSFLGEYQGKVIPKYVDFDLVYNTLHQLLQGTEPSYEKMIKILEDHVEQKYKNYWVQDVINNLEDASQQIKFQFVVDMTKHYVNMKKVLWSKVRKFFAGQLAGFDYVVTTIDDNANSIKQTILTAWQNNLKDTELVSFVDDEYVFNKETAKAIIDEAESWNKTNLPSKETLGTWFEKLGIIVDDNVLQTLADGKFNYNGTKYSYDSLFTNKEGLVKAIADSLKKSINQDIAISDDNFIRQSVVERLAMYQAKNSANVFSNSHRSGDKTVYSFSMNKFAFDRMRKLLDPSKKLATALKSVAFSKDSTWLSWILEDNKTLMNGFSLNYVSLDPFKEMGKGERQSKDLQKLTEGEHEAYKVGLFTSNAATPGDIKGVKYRLTNFMYPTMADKKNAFIMGAYGRVTEVKADGTISDSTIQAIKDNVVIPEINRMIALGKKTINQKGTNDKSIYNFYFLPELNNLVVDGESLLNHIKNGDVYPTKFDKEIDRIITDYVNALVEEKLQVWKDNNIGKSDSKERFTYMNSAYMNNIAKGSNPEAKLKYAATDMVVNYMIANGNIYQMFLTDPMNYAKFDGDKNLDMAETMSNIGKRLAFDAAPGNTLANADTEEYIQVFLKDANTPSTEIEDYKKLFKNNPEAVKTYEDIEGTDAQEFTTLREHLHVMNLRGLLPDGFYDNVASIIGREVSKGNFYYYDDIIKGLPEEQKPVFEKLVLQVMKPVMTENIIDNVTGHERRLYIKSSALPLVPAITKNMEIDKLRIALEKAENKYERTVRAVFSTGTKLGFVNKPINVYNNDGTVVESDAIFEAIKTTDADFTAMMLTRSGFRIQQDVPYSEDHVEINKGTQESKMMFTDLLNVKGFKLPGETKSYTGEELQKLYYDTYKQLYEINLGKLEEDLVDADGLVDTTKLYKILKDELLVRGASINELLGLELKDGAFKIPLWGNPSSLKIQALLNSIVNNRINKIKLPGTSFILGTEEGFQSKPKKAVIEGEEAEEFIRTSKTDIIFTENWEGKLRAAHTDEKGVFHPDQVLVPPRFMYNGKLVDIQQFVTIRKEEDGTETWMINADRMPSSLLKMFGFRIPTSGHMSMASIEIVGFLPESAGDLVIAPRDFTKRMGSDFDVDKLYAYMYATKVEKTTQGLVLMKDDSEESKLKNTILDIHLAIMGNPDAVVQSKIKTPIGYGGLKELGNEVATKKAESEGKKLTTILSDEYYKTKYLNAASGKAAVGVFSLNVVFNGLAQGKNLKLQSFNADGKDVYSVTFGNWKSNGNLSSEKGFTGEYKSLIHSAFQNAALDNEKEAILEKLNINNNTFDFIRSMTQLGYPEDLTSAIINQDVIYSYIELLNKYSSSLFEFTANAQGKAVQEIIKNLGLEKLNDEELDAMFKLADFEGMTGEEATKKLKDMIANPTYPDYNKYQLSILYKFISLSKDGKDIQDLQTAINIDAAGIGKNLFETSTRLNNVYKLINSSIANAEKMIGNFTIDEDGEVAAIEPTTINGFAVVYALEPANKLWGRFFNPIVSKSFDKIWSEYLNVTMTQRMSSNQKSEQMKDLFEDMVSYIYTRNGVISNDINADRARLFIDTTTNKSLASILKSIADNPYVQKNAFLNKLFAQIEKNGNPSKITINAASGENFDEQSIYLGALEMLVGPNQTSLGEFNGINYTPRTLMEDLFKYAYLGDPTQGAIQFTKYLPLSYLIDNNFGGKLRAIDFSADDTFGTYENSSEPSVYITQWAQHNGNRLPKVSDDDIIIEKEKSLEKATIITLKGKAVEKFQGYPTFISAYNSNAVGTGNKYYIFKKVIIDSDEGQKAVYQKIDSLGAFGMNEYNANVLNQTSVIERQQVKTKPIVSTATEVKQGPEVITNTAKITDAEKLGIKKAQGKEAIKTILNNIASKSSNPYYRVLAEELAKHTDVLPSKINVAINDTMQSYGTYNYDTFTITINTKEGVPPVIMEKAFLHELIHAFTGDVASRFERLGVKNFVETAEDKNAARKQVQFMLRLSRLKSQFIQDVYKKGQGAAFEDFISRYEARKKGKKDVDFTTAEINTFYGGYSLSEFISMSMTEPEFQEILNSIPDANNLPWYQSIVNVIKNILDSILGLKSDSVLASSIDTTIDYINSIQTTEDVVEELQTEPVVTPTVEKAELPAGGIKEGVQELFESNPELANIGTPQQYSAYLDTIFPDSKVKDIVYHGTDQKFEKFTLDYFGKSSAVINEIDVKGVSVSGDKKGAELYGNIILPVVVSITNPTDNILSGNSEGVITQNWKDKDALLDSSSIVFGGKKPISDTYEILIRNPEQIHILGNKQDVEGFTNFVKGKTGTFAEDNLGMSVGEFMKTLSKEERSIMRDAMGKVFKTKCK